MFVRFLMILACFLVLSCKEKGPAATATVTPEATKAPEKPESAAETKKAVAEEKKEQPVAKKQEKGNVADTLPDPVAEVNGEAVTAKAFGEALLRYQRPGLNIPPERLGRLRKTLLNRLVDEALIDQAIKKDGVETDIKKLEEDFNKYKSRFKNESQYTQYLERSGMTEKRIREQLKKTLLLVTLLERRGGLDVKDEEAKDFYGKHQNLYQERETVHAAHILIKVPKDADDAAKEDAKKRITAAQKALKKKKAFDELAKEISEGPSAPRGGDLGFFGRGQMVKEFEEVAFSLKPGKVSKPVQTPFGWHLIKVLDKKEGRTKKFEEVKPRLVESLRRKKFAQQKRDLLKSLRDQATIKNHTDF